VACVTAEELGGNRNILGMVEVKIHSAAFGVIELCTRSPTSVYKHFGTTDMFRIQHRNTMVFMNHDEGVFYTVELGYNVMKGNESFVSL
jgi:hypothetical protein